MWKLEVEGSADDIYTRMKRKFDEEHVEKESYEFTVRRRNGQTSTHTKERAIIDDDTSLQFRRILKFVQVLTEDMRGKLKVSCEGEPGKSIEVKVEKA